MEQSVSKQQPPLPPIPELEGGLTPADIWLGLHTGEKSWTTLECEVDRLEFKEMRNGSDLHLMQCLASLPKDRWIALCDGTGWMPMAIAALSWCQEVTLDDILNQWTLLPPDQALPTPGNIAERAAGFINPELLPANRMSAFLSASNHLVAIAVMIAARKEPPEMDIPQDMASRLNTQLKALLVPRHERVAAEQTAREQSAAAAKAQHEAARQKLLRGAASLLPERMETREWSRQHIRDALSAGDKGAVPGHPCGEARRYIDPDTQRTLLADRETGDVLHTGRKVYIYGFPSDTEAPERLEWPKFRQDDLVTIYVPLLKEGASVWRPVKAQYMRGNVFYIPPRQSRPYDEQWGCGMDQFYHCEPRRFYEGVFIAAMKLAERIQW